MDSIIKKIDEKLKKLDFEKVNKYDSQKSATGYKDYVSLVKSIIYKNRKNMLAYRFLIEYDLEGGEEDKTALFIMKNPSQADKNMSDKTVNKILGSAHYLKYSKAYIMNLFPEYNSKPDDIHIECLTEEALEKVLIEHDKLIESVCDEVTCIFVAWGSNNVYGKAIKDFYNRRISSVKDELKKVIKKEGKTVRICCQHYNKDNEPTHPAARQLEYKWVIEKEEDDYLPWPKI